MCCASVRIDLPVASSAGSISAAHDPSPGWHASSALHSYGHCAPCPEETVVISYLLTQSPPQGSHAPAQSTSGSVNTVGAAIALATTALPPTEMVIPVDVSATVATLHENHSNSGSGQRSGNSQQQQPTQRELRGKGRAVRAALTSWRPRSSPLAAHQHATRLLLLPRRRLASSAAAAAAWQQRCHR